MTRASRPDTRLSELGPSVVGVILCGDRFEGEQLQFIARPQFPANIKEIHLHSNQYGQLWSTLGADTKAEVFVHHPAELTNWNLAHIAHRPAGVRFVYGDRLDYATAQLLNDRHQCAVPVLPVSQLSRGYC